MKTMTCNQLAGACDMEFQANTFEEIGELSKKHAMEMASKGDQAHITKMEEMTNMMNNPKAMQDWWDQKKAEFNALPDSK